MSKPIAYQGLVKEGPLKGRVLTHTSARYEGKFQDAAGDDVVRGFYVFRAARGLDPGEWRWIAAKESK